MGNLETKLLRFQRLIWRIVGFCILLGSRDIRKNIKRSLSVNLRIFKNRRNDNENLRLLPGHFSPTSGLLSAVGYLEPKLLRSRRWEWHIIGFCSSIIIEVMAQNVKITIFGNFWFCKKNWIFYIFYDISTTK